MSDEKLVAIPVSVAEQILSLARALLPFVVQASLERNDAEGILVPRNGSWTKSMVEALRREIERYENASALFDFAADHADRPVTYKEFLDATGLDARKVGAELAAVSKAARRLFDRKIWPLTAWQGASGEMRYQMPGAVARWWRDSG